MTPDDCEEKNDSKLEDIVQGMKKALTKIDSVVRGTYDQIANLVKRCDDIYDFMAYKRDHPCFDPGNGYDLLDGVDD